MTRYSYKLWLWLTANNKNGWEKIKWKIGLIIPFIGMCFCCCVIHSLLSLAYRSFVWMERTCDGKYVDVVIMVNLIKLWIGTNWIELYIVKQKSELYLLLFTLFRINSITINMNTYCLGCRLYIYDYGIRIYSEAIIVNERLIIYNYNK